MKKRVLLESPYGSDDKAVVAENIRYARACMRDCFLRGEDPFASHLLYPQPGILDDRNPDERRQGIEAGLAWGSLAELTVVYTDRGLTDGMKKGIERAIEEGRPIEYRELEGWQPSDCDTQPCEVCGTRTYHQHDDGICISCRPKENHADHTT